MIDTILNNRYRLDAAIGEGGMAVVYRGYDLLLRRQVAVKVLRPQHAADQSFVQRFYEEARAAAKLSHPNIVNTYDVGEVNGSHYIVEEFVTGETLATLVARQKTLPESVAVRYARQICLALGAAHRADLLHRDIKPSNVLITPDDIVRVTDFGIARAANAATLSGVEAIMGSIPYCSPEQLSGGPLFAASDLYSLGVVLFESVTGHQPYVAETALGVAMAHVNSPIPDPNVSGADVSLQLRDTIVKLLQKNPAGRYQSAGEALAALRRCGRREELDETSGADATAILGRRTLAGQGSTGVPDLVEPEPAWNLRRMVALGAGALLGIVIISAVIASREASPHGLTLPDLTGKSQIDAVAALHDIGIDAVVFRQRDDPNAPSGLVDGSDPAPNVPMKPGDSVVLYLSSGPQRLPVPNVIGKDPKIASSILANVGLVVRIGTSIHSNSVKQGLVAQTNPAPNSPVERGGTVALNPSSGPMTVQVPNIVSTSIDDARKQLAKLGLKLQANIVPSLDIPARTVIDQDPVVGSTAPPGSTVTADVSAGPNAVTVPNVVGTSVEDARMALEQAGLALGNVAHAAVGDTSPGTVVGQHPAPNSQAPQGTPVDLVVASALSSPQPQPSSSGGGTPVPNAAFTVPNVIGMSLEEARAALAKAGLSVDRVTVLPGSPPTARVVRTEPAPGATTAPGSSSVNLVLGGR